ELRRRAVRTTAGLLYPAQSVASKTPGHGATPSSQRRHDGPVTPPKRCPGGQHRTAVVIPKWQVRRALNRSGARSAGQSVVGNLPLDQVGLYRLVHALALAAVGGVPLAFVGDQHAVGELIGKGNGPLVRRGRVPRGA